MLDNKDLTKKLQPALSLWNEPNWPRDRLGNPYDFARHGDQISRGLILAALVPKSPDKRTRWGHVKVLDVLQQRLHRGRKRNNRSDHPAFGNYVYTWDKLDVLAMQAGMPVTSFRNCMNDLRKWGLVYVAQASLSEPNSYRLTDSAFLVAQTLQLIPLCAEWLAGEPQDSLTDEDIAFVDWLSAANWAGFFPRIMADPDTQALLTQWHKSDDGQGNKLSPLNTGLRVEALTHLAEVLEMASNWATSDIP